MTLSVGSLFSGIGGIDKGLEDAGMQVKWQCEKDPWCRKILAKHWPGVPCYEDITTLQFEALEHVDVLAGGFPCQDISQLGPRTGITGARSGLWKYMVSSVRLVRPKYVIVENVAALRQRGMGIVLGDLAESGYDTEWDCVPASAVGAPMRRERVYMVAQPQCQRGKRCIQETIQRVKAFSWNQDVRRVEDLRGRPSIPEPLIRRNGNGVPYLMDRLRGVGNSVIPGILEWLGRHLIRLD